MMPEAPLPAAEAERRRELLNQVPLFTCFTPEELERIAGLFVEVSYRKGDTICTAGDEGDTFFVIVSGELDVWSGGAQKRIINRLGPGDFLGEMALLLGGQRAATVTVARNARLLALNKAAFDTFFRHNPKVIEYFSKELCRRLAVTTRGDVAQAPTTVVSITALAHLRGKTLVATSLAALLREFSGQESVRVEWRSGRGGGAAQAPGDLVAATVAVIERRLEPDALDTPCLVLSGRRLGAPDLVPIIAQLGRRFSFVVLDLGTEGSSAQVAEELSDVVVRIVDRVEVPPASNGDRRQARVFQVLNLYNRGTAPLAISHCEPFVLAHDAALDGLDTRAQVQRLAVRPASPPALTLRRLARKILGTTVGLALGGGAAFGIAHIGVLKVLEDNAIPVDLLTGCSMGSIVALGYAAGLRAPDMIDIARRIGTKWMTLSAMLDVALTKPGLLLGNRLIQIFGPLLPREASTFEQIGLPCQVVAADIETGERVCIGAGRLDLAFRASCSVPMIWSPISRDGRILVDGGVVDPVPAEVVRDMGADICIAVNAVPRLKKGVQTVLSRLYRTLNPMSYIYGQSLPSTFDLIMNSMQVLQHELGHFKAISADVRINLDLSGYTWIEFYRATELIERGIEATERSLPEIKRVLAERLKMPRRAEVAAASA